MKEGLQIWTRMEGGWSKEVLKMTFELSLER